MLISPQPLILLVAYLLCRRETRGAKGENQSGKSRCKGVGTLFRAPAKLYVYTPFCCSETSLNLMGPA